MNTFTGKNVDEAIQNALNKLAIEKNQANIKVIQTEKKGFLGFGKRDAIVEVTVIQEPETKTPKSAADDQDINTKASNAAKSASIEFTKSKDEEAEPENDAEDTKQAVTNLQNYLDAIVTQLSIHATSEVVFKNSKTIKINFDTKEEGLLIGKHGLTINALQTLAEIYLNRLGIYHVVVELDTANYRQRRLDILEKLAEKTARDVVAEGKPVYLDPMPSFERKKIHKTLENHQHVRTYSAGREPYRAVVVVPK
ncbi:RNA-binding cell elongation regulator Jag/EloR [Lactobacillus sp. Sy-1]|uniref:RNA-binding cell elongation regulator Jag/EloR n=1 Tax=Lactobacillus sp. Sy-1 TaxID=2109645 RepID=UPI001C5669DC|nr:RNA-binding cell elongation regulator Jag/EloR [Lactobacillus sp. Sy-1]MBW1604985.1 protein jag [Lactobacillus sp. Sy-1]